MLIFPHDIDWADTKKQVDKSVSEYHLNQCHEEKWLFITHLKVPHYSIICMNCKYKILLLTDKTYSLCSYTKIHLSYYYFKQVQGIVKL